MKSKINRILVITFFLIMMAFSVKVQAADATLGASSTTATVGDKVTVEININAATWNLKIKGDGISEEKIVGYDAEGNNVPTNKKYTIDTSSAKTCKIYLEGDVTDGVTDKNKLINTSVTIKINDPAPKDSESETPKVEEKPEFKDGNKTMYAANESGNGINLRTTWSTTSNATYVDNGTELTVTGTSSNKVNGYVWYRVKYNGQTKYVASYLLSDKKPVEQPKEEPTDEPTEEPETNEEPTDIKQRLTSLEIEGFTLSPKFDPEVYEYRVIVKEDISQLKINALSDIEGAVVSIAGNDNLQEGENLITIVVYNAQNEAQATYQITTNKATIDLSQTDKILQMGTKEAKRNATIFVLILAMTFIALIVVMILRAINKRKNHKQEQYGDETIENEAVQEFIENNEGEKTEFTETEQIVENKSENAESTEENNTKITKQPTEKEINDENIIDDAKRQEYIDTIISEKRKGKYF